MLRRLLPASWRPSHLPAYAHALQQVFSNVQVVRIVTGSKPLLALQVTMSGAVIVVCASAAANLLESYLGAMVQGQQARLYRNDVMNMLQITAAALLAVAFVQIVALTTASYRSISPAQLWASLRAYIWSLHATRWLLVYTIMSVVLHAVIEQIYRPDCQMCRKRRTWILNE